MPPYCRNAASASAADSPLKWAAPEVLIGKRHVVGSEIWSFGVFLWEPVLLPIALLPMLLVLTHCTLCPSDKTDLPLATHGRRCVAGVTA